MRFWDSSALVPLLLEERATAAARRLLSEDGVVLAWALTPLEILSALWRRRRTDDLSEADLVSAEDSLRQLEGVWSLISDLDHVERRARRMLAVHPLRAGDAAQLAAALVASGERPDLLPFVTSEATLAEAARKEGFTVLS